MSEIISLEDILKQLYAISGILIDVYDLEAVSYTHLITPVVYMYNAVFGTTGSTARDAGVGAAVGILMALIVLVVFGLVNVLVKDDDLEF